MSHAGFPDRLPSCPRCAHDGPRRGLTHDKPCAAPGLTSYRYRGRYGFIMIGATDDADAMREAERSGPYTDPERLEVWNGSAYVQTQEPQS